MERKNKLKVAIVIFIYEAASRHFANLVNSINCQTDSNFEVIIFNDNAQMPNKHFKRLRSKYRIINLIDDSPCGLRFQGFEILKGLDFDVYIFQDCDDELSNNRVRIISFLANEYKLVVNDIDLINISSELYESNIWKNRFKGSPLFKYEDIASYNFVGLGNSTIHKDLLDFFPKRPKLDVVALDWYIFYSVLKKTLISGYFTSSCTTLYRQHPENEIGIAEFDKLNRIIVEKNRFNQLIGSNLIIEEKTTNVLPTQKSNNFPFWWELKKKQ